MAGGRVPDSGGAVIGGTVIDGTVIDGTVIALRRPGRGGQPRPRRYGDVQRFLDPAMCEVIGRQQMMFVACPDGRGGRHRTFRAGPPGFVTVLDPRRLAWREHHSDPVLAGLHTIRGSLSLGLLFVDFFREVAGLHVHGRATLLGPGSMVAIHSGRSVDPVRGRHAERCVVLRVDEAWLDRVEPPPVPPLTVLRARSRAAPSPTAGE